jgi:prephenate dehydratase
MNIGISGAKGSFSEQAARTYAEREHVEHWTLEYLVSVKNVLEALTKGEVDLGIFPIENSNGGIVIEAVHAMAQYTFSIQHIFEIDVHHCLLVQKGVSVSSISTIVSHDQALKQCRMYLKRRWNGIELQEYPDTAQAAADLANGTLPSSAAVIAPKRCAELYNLDVLEESIQDLKFNFTTFVAAKR